MSRLHKKITVLGFLILAIISNSFGQEGVISINQNEKLPKLLEVKSEIELDRFRIQIFSGQMVEATKALKKSKLAFDSKWKNDLEYETPNYKVWVGKFKSRLEADRALLKIKEEFPDAFVFKPQKKKKKK